jgi:hypothetical protein
MNWRILGCAVFAAAAFIGLGLLALNLAIGRVGCPPTVQWGDRLYAAVGEPTDVPVVGEGEPVLLGSTFIGALTREVYGPEGADPSPTAGDVLPDAIALACGDDTYQTYAFTSVVPTPAPSP